MSDETDANDHEREKILSRNVYKIDNQCEELLRITEKIADIGLDKLSNDIDNLIKEIRRNTRDIQNRFEYTTWKERQYFITNDKDDYVMKCYTVFLNIPIFENIGVADVKRIVTEGIGEIGSGCELYRVDDRSSQ